MRRVDGVTMIVISTNPCIVASNDSTDAARLTSAARARVVVGEALTEPRRHRRRSGFERRFDDRIVRADAVDRHGNVALTSLTHATIPSTGSARTAPPSTPAESRRHSRGASLRKHAVQMRASFVLRPARQPSRIVRSMP